MILQPGQRGSNGSHGKRPPYIRKNILKRNYAQLTQDAIDRRSLRLRKPEYVKRDLGCRPFGTLVAMNCVGVDSQRRTWWSVVCLCGNVDVVRADGLIRGHNLRLKCCKGIKA